MLYLVERSEGQVAEFYEIFVIETSPMLDNVEQDLGEGIEYTTTRWA